MKMRRFFYRFPGQFYACGPAVAASDRMARAALRITYGLARLPRGFELWEAE